MCLVWGPNDGFGLLRHNLGPKMQPLRFSRGFSAILTRKSCREVLGKGVVTIVASFFHRPGYFDGYFYCGTGENIDHGGCTGGSLVGAGGGKRRQGCIIAPLFHCICMPIYEYLCANKACLHRFEVLQKISEPDPGQCPECDQSELTRALNAPRFQLKGSGWYISDFRNSDKPVAGGSVADKDGDRAQASRNEADGDRDGRSADGDRDGRSSDGSDNASQNSADKRESADKNARGTDKAAQSDHGADNRTNGRSEDSSEGRSGGKNTAESAGRSRDGRDGRDGGGRSAGASDDRSNSARPSASGSLGDDRGASDTRSSSGAKGESRDGSGKHANNKDTGAGSSSTPPRPRGAGSPGRETPKP